MRRRKILVAGAVFLVLLVALVWLLGGGRGGQKLKASVGFLGYTNLQDGSRMALFGVTNEGRVRLEVGCWFTGFNQGTNRTSIVIVQSPDIFIPAGEMRIIPVEHPPTAESWSCTCRLLNRGARMRLARALVPKTDGWWRDVVRRYVSEPEWGFDSKSPPVPPPPAP